MFKRMVIGVAAGIGLMIASPVMASDGSDLAGKLAAGLQDMVGKQPDSDLSITAITAEADVLVFRLDGPAQWRGGVQAGELSDALVEGLCEEGSFMFDQGVKVRVDTTEDGGKKLMTGPIVDHCPAKSS